MKFNAKGYNIKKISLLILFPIPHLPEVRIVSNLFFPKKLSNHIQAHTYFSLLFLSHKWNHKTHAILQLSFATKYYILGIFSHFCKYKVTSFFKRLHSIPL